MGEQEALFDLIPDENTGEIEQTEIEYIFFAFADNKKKELIILLESILLQTDLDNHSDLIFKIVKEKHEEINS